MFSSLYRVWQGLTEPSPDIQMVEERHRARLLASLLVIVFPLTLASATLQLLTVPNYLPVYAVVIVTIASMLPCYALSRTHQYQAGATLGLLLSASGCLITYTIDHNLLNLWVLPTGLMAASHLKSWRGVLALGIYNTVCALVLLLTLNVGPQPIIVILSFLVIATLMNGASAYNRQQNENRYLALFEQSNDAVVIVDLLGNYLSVNQKMADMLGYTTREFRAMNVRDVVTPDERDNVARVLQRIVQNKSIPVFERPLLAKNGSTSLVEINATLLYDANNRPCAIQAIMRDISERKQVEKQLQYQASILQHVNEAVIATDNQFIIQSWNPAAERIYGWGAEETVGKPFNDIIKTDYTQQSHSIFSAFVEMGHSSGEITQMRKDGSRVSIWTSGTQLKDSRGNLVGTVLVNRDITERKRLEQNALELAIEKAQAETLRRFITHTSHDLRNPLSILNTSLYLLRRKLPPDVLERSADHLRQMEEQMQQLTRILDDFVDISRLESDSEPFHLKPVHLMNLTHRLFLQLEPLAERHGHSLHFRCDDEHLTIEADEVQLSRAIQNLVVNAVSYTPQGGDITLAVYQQDNRAVVEVRDNGIGITEAEIPRIFESFYRTDPARSIATGGAGLGLPIAHHIVQKHGGSIGVDSAPGAGSVFRIYLPLSTPAADRQALVPASAGSQTSH
jgi:PAS domain S-box-containing protein